MVIMTMICAYFSLCKKCSCEHPEGGKASNYSCSHSDNERQFISTVTSIELNEALAVGYTVNKIYRVLEFEQWSEDIFKGYVREFMKIKIEASGFPDGIVSEDQKQQFIEENWSKLGIRLEIGNIKKNPSMRTLAKLCLNSLWGRFSLRNQLSRTIVTNDPFDVQMYYNDHRYNLNAGELLPNGMYLISYTPKLEFIDEHDCSNIIISLWTTSSARIRMLKALQIVAKTPNSDILYMDTDSIIYSHYIDKDLLECGPHLGDFTDECIGKNIIEFFLVVVKIMAISISMNLG
jgi:hypothetical protein